MLYHKTTATTAKVLIVDDEANMRKTLAEILRDRRYQVTTAAGREKRRSACVGRIALRRS
jgi:DNA-binding response OmpR family regulator